MKHQIQEKDNVIREKVLVSNVNDRGCEPYNTNDVTDLLEQNERLRTEIENVKQHYKEMFESIKITRTSTNEKASSLLTQIEDLKAQLELTDREQKIDEQIRIIISDRNRKETSLKSELHSAQLQLRFTLNHHKIVREEAIILKKDFKQKEDKFLEEFLDIKRLKEKVEDRLYKQDQSVQTVHMICKPKSFYDEKNKVA
ncbi:hypothetical protein Tco_0198533, partial [Tanacetum coccineum]